MRRWRVLAVLEGLALLEGPAFRWPVCPSPARPVRHQPAGLVRRDQRAIPVLSSKSPAFVRTAGIRLRTTLAFATLAFATLAFATPRLRDRCLRDPCLRDPCLRATPQSTGSHLESGSEDHPFLLHSARLCHRQLGPAAAWRAGSGLAAAWKRLGGPWCHDHTAAGLRSKFWPCAIVSGHIHAIWEERIAGHRSGGPGGRPGRRRLTAS